MTIASMRQTIPTRQSSAQHYDVVVVGAGPYGLSIAAHIADIGLKVAIFGKPLELWHERMPGGIFLRSHWWATNLSDPQKKYGLKQFFNHSGYSICYPMPIRLFNDYGLWFQQQAVPFLDPTYISSIEYLEKRFFMTLENGRSITATAVVMAIGIRCYQHIPAEFAHLPSELLTHSGEHSNFSRFAGKNIAVIGGGQCAVEWAALLNEAGASVELIARRPISWIEHHGEGSRSLVEQLIAPSTGIAIGWKYRLLELFPYFFQRLPQEKKARMVKNSYWPGASNWLQDRVFGKVVIHEGCTILGVEENEKRAKLTLSDGINLNVDHIIAATGYQADITRLTMLHPSLIAKIETYHGSPILNPWFESSAPGLYFTGFSAIQSFGPLYRFIAGVPATAPRIAHAVKKYVAKAC